MPLKASKDEVELSKELQLLNAQEAVNKIMSIQKYAIWIMEWNEGGSEVVRATHTAYSDFLNSEGQVLLNSNCSMQALQLALERAEKWEAIADYVRTEVRKRESELQVWS